MRKLGGRSKLSEPGFFITWMFEVGCAPLVPRVREGVCPNGDESDEWVVNND